MAQGYHHMTQDLRSQIHALKARNISHRKIAQQLEVHHTTIGRELKRNTTDKGYCPLQAHDKALQRRALASSHRKEITAEFKAIITDYIEQDYSPVQISGRLKKLGQGSISHESIYHFIWEDKKQGGCLYRHLRHQGKKYHHRGSDKPAGRGHIPGRVDIRERPAIVEEKSRVGDWEADLIIGTQKKSAVLLTLVERKTKFLLICKLKDKTALGVSEAIMNQLKDLPVHTITYDNGKEFAGHASIAKALNAQCFFATPYHSWERGLNEHHNGLIRQYFPKKTCFDDISVAQIESVQHRLNNRPRKVLEYDSPIESFLRAVSQKTPFFHGALRC
jgi:transposase, IS30 family